MSYNPESEKSRAENDESGYSEKQTDLNMEIQAGEWQQLRKFKTFQQRSRQGKIIAMYQAVSNRLNQLVALYYKFINIDQEKAVKLLEELRKLRYMQEVLLNCLVWEPNGQLERGMIPDDVWELIE